MRDQELSTDATPSSPPTPLEYGSGVARRGNQWGTASCVRAAIAFAVIAYLYLTVYSVRPQNTVMLVFCWPIVSTFCAFGVWYGIRGIRRDAMRRRAVIGLVANAVLAGPSISGTIDAGREIRIAYRYTGGVIIMADR